WVGEGLEGGRAAMLQKIHHALTDGEGGVRMSAEFIDFSRDQADAEPVPDEATTTADGPATNIVAAAVDTAAHDLRRGLGIGRRAAEEAVALARDPSRVPRAGAEVVATVQSGLRQLAVTDPARSPLRTERSLRHPLER